MASRLLQIQTSALQGYRELVTELGGKPQLLLRDSGIDEALLESDSSRISTQAMGSLLSKTAESLSCPEFGMMLGARQNFFALGELGKLLQHCNTFSDALVIGNSMMAYHNQGEVWFYQTFADFGYLYRQDLTEQVQENRQFKELAFAICLQLARAALGNENREFRIEFSHQAGCALSVYQKYLKVPVLFNCESDAVVFPVKYLQQKFVHTDSDAFNKAEYNVSKQLQIRALGIKEKVSALIQQNLHAEAPSIEFIAELLEMNVRTLQRRMLESDCRYKTLLTETRMTMAKRYLACSELDVTLIAQLVGYSELPNFTRAFKQYTGLAPLNWRKNGQL